MERGTVRYYRARQYPECYNATMNFRDEILKTANIKIIFTAHAVEEMNARHELITVEEIRDVLFKGEIIEDYPEDKRGHSCLMFYYSEHTDRPVHAVCAPKDEYCAVITAYIPSSEKWDKDYRTRRKK